MNAVNMELTRIYDTHGRLTPSLVLDYAKSPASPLHTSFEWNDAKAGHQYRLNQSRKLIRKCRVIYQNREEECYHVRAANVDSREGYYKPVSAIVADTDEFDLALSEVRRRLESIKYAYERLLAVARNRHRDDLTMGKLLIITDAIKLASSTMQSLQ